MGATETVREAGAGATAYDLGCLVEASLSRSVDGCGVRARGRTHTRGEILTGLLDLAARLRRLGVAPGEPILVEIAHSCDLVVALCGVLKAGAAAAPVDPSLSEERRRAIYADVRPRLVLRADPATGGPVITEVPGAARVASPGLAFLVYTSGSSGGPKGVEISHESYARRLQHIVSANPAPRGDVDLMWTPASFIGMLDEVFFPLLQGIPAVVAEQKERGDPDAFADLVSREGVTLFRITPSLLNAFLTPGTAARLAGVRAIFCSGETLGADVQRKVHALLPATLIGFYGATEAPGVAFHVYDPAQDPHERTRCKPQEFAAIRVVDSEGRDVTAGEKGEIFIGGPALARGYWRRPGLTEEKFIVQGDRRWYRTGDLGAWRGDGSFEVCGRVDLSEVKIRGVRVSLPEIIKTLRGLEGIEGAWVSAVETTGADTGCATMLVGHYVTGDAAVVDPKTIRARLGQLLPNAAVPQVFLRHDHFPLTANGKLDQQALKHAAANQVQSRAGATNKPRGAPSAVSPESRDLLQRVLSTTEALLKVEGLTGDEDFFDLGGDSLTAIQLTHQLSETLGGEDLSANVVFNTGSLAELAVAVAGCKTASSGAMRLLRGSRRSTRPVITINATGKYTALAKHLDQDYAVYNLNIFGLTDDLIDRVETLTLQDLAQRLAAQVLDRFPRGPWSIVAYCQGGCLAVEIGRILQATGRGRCDLLLIDTFFLDHRRTLKMSLLRALDLGPSYYLHKLRSRFSAKSGQAPSDAESVERSAEQIRKSRDDSRLYARFVEFFRSYNPEAYDGRVVLMMSREWRRVPLGSVRRLAGHNLTVRVLPGLHDTIFTAETVPALARVLNEELKKAEAGT